MTPPRITAAEAAASPRLIYPDGRPVPASDIARARLSANVAYQGASVTHQDMAAWRPAQWSAQSALSFDRDIITARIHDIARNDGWASAAMDRQVDSVIGAGWRLSAKPNARSLGIDPDAAAELAVAIEAEWEDYADDAANWCDVGRRMTAGQLDALAYRHRIMDGEALGVIYWLERGGPYATAMQVIDPDRLSQPRGIPETETLRAGVEMDAWGAPVAYHIRAAHPGDLFVRSVNLFVWERVERETAWGRPRVAHAFDSHRAGQVRGAPPLAPILKKLKQLTRYDEAELQAAILNAVLAAFIQSPMDHEQLATAMSGSELDSYTKARLAHYAEEPLRLEGVQVGFLYPGEQVQFTPAARPSDKAEAFVRGGLRNIATAAGLSYEQLTMDWSQVNYSSARAALLEVWRGLAARKSGFAAQWKQPWYCAWLEEAIARGRIRLPAGAPDFAEKRAAYCKAEWIGPGRGWVDPQREAEAAAMRIANNVSTLERECQEQGLDWREVAQQRRRERAYLESLGLDPDAGRPEARFQQAEEQPLEGQGVQ